MKQVRRDSQTGPLYWQGLDFNADGKVTREQVGNGVQTDRVFSAETGLLREINSSVQQLRYTWDAVGNLTQRRDLQQLVSGQPLTENFVQDGVNRLTSATVVGQPAATVSYDQLGNILTKNGWTYSYAQNASGQAVNHRVAAVNGVAYTYDGNGNITSGGGRTLEWTSFNLPRRIVKGAAESRFGYGFQREMVSHEVWQNGAQVSRTTYVGDYERIEEGAVIKHRVHVAGGLAVITLRTEPGQTETETTRWLHHDHLGSVSAVSNENGVAIERHSFDAWGKRRATDWQPAPASAVLTSEWSLRGFTGHEQLDAVGLVQIAVGLVHMKGRVYNPELGRFTSADPYVEDATVPGMLNRYSYVLNRPLSATDPSGHFVAIIAGLVAAVVAGVGGAAAGTAIAGALGWAAATTDATIASLIVAGVAAGFANSFVSTLTAGGSIGQAFRGGLTGALWGGVTAGLAFGVGHILAPALSSATGIATELAAGVGHALVGGALAEAQGGDFWSGLISAGVGYGAGMAAHAWFKNGAPIDIAGRTAIAAVAGGTASELTGGKFANGAKTAAFQHLFNDEITRVDRRDPASLPGNGETVRLTDEELLAELERTFQRIERANLSKLSFTEYRDFMAGFDTVFYDARKYWYTGNLSQFSAAFYRGYEINCFGVGMAFSARGLAWKQAVANIRIWKIQYGEAEPSPATIGFANLGYRFYDIRKELGHPLRVSDLKR